MKKMKLILASLAIALISASSASAIIIDLSLVNGQPINNGNGTILTWAEGAVTDYNAFNDPDLPTNLVSGFRNNTGEDNDDGIFTSTVFGNDSKSLSINVSGYEYITLHWGGPGQGSLPDPNSRNNKTPNNQLFYIGGESTFFADNTIDNNGLSYYELFNAGSPTTPPVTTPDAGSTLALMGIALAGLGALKRRK